MCDKSVPGMFRYERKLQKILKSFEIYEHKDNHYINKKKKQKYLKSLNGLIGHFRNQIVYCNYNEKSFCLSKIIHMYCDS